MDTYDDLGKVCLDEICEKNPRLALARQIAEQQKFLHWELEFADLFAERGGFDLILGNPPWIKLGWNEQAVLSDTHPEFAVKNMNATQTAGQRKVALVNQPTKTIYFSAYEAMSGQQNFMNALQNYSVLKGQQTNLYKCFLPQAWVFGNKEAVSSFVHPDSVYDDPNGGVLREVLYPRLRKHYKFTNELKLFAEVDHHARFSVNIYCNSLGMSFDVIANLFDAAAIDQSYDDSIVGTIPGIKDEYNNWSVKGHPGRVVRIGKKELSIFAKLFDGNDNWRQARLPVLHAGAFIEVLERFVAQEKTLAAISEGIFTSAMWHETTAQKEGVIKRNVHFPEALADMIYSGSHIGIANPLFKSSRRECKLNSDFDNVDLTHVSNDYLQRCNYSPAIEISKYVQLVPSTKWGVKHTINYRLITRSMLNLSGERTLFPAIIPNQTAHINTTFSFFFKNNEELVQCAAIFASLPFDFLLKISGKGIAYWDVYEKFPFFSYDGLVLRCILLNCLSKHYKGLWQESYSDSYCADSWSKPDPRLRPERFTNLTPEWTWNTPLRTDYERRQALVEIDVLTSMALGMTLEQLKTIYRIQFPVLQSYEADTWYDRNGRIVFTNNRSLTGVGYSRAEWEQIKDAPSGTFTRTITDDTQPGGPVERTIEYVAPFDRCDREQDYETAWRFFEGKYESN